MKRNFNDIEQNTAEWLEMRMGKFTASTFSDLFMSKSTIARQKAIYKPVYERLTGDMPEQFMSDWMERGHELEPMAIEAYEEETFNEVDPGGFWTLDDWIGASPDGLVGDDGLVEVKCPAFNTMIEYLIKAELPKKYYWQVHGQIYVTGRKWCDFMAYHPNLKPLIIRVERDEEVMKKLEPKLIESIEEAKKIIELIK
jgi:putative phage-type endonuclease